MDISGLKKELASGKRRNLYLFVGVERGMMDLYIKKIANKTIKASKFKDILPKLTGGKLFTQSMTYVVRDDVELVEQDIDLLKLIGANTVILCYSAIDGRSKFYKRYKDLIIDFEKVDEKQLRGFIARELNIDDNLASLIATRSNNDFSRIELEIDKLKRVGVLGTAVINSMVVQSPEDIIFDVIKSVLMRDIHKAFNGFYELKERGESPIKIISLLYTGFRNILLVQGMETSSDKEIGAKTGLNPWHIKHMREQINYYTSNDLLSILRLVQGAEFGIKMGAIEQDVAMEKLLIDILT